MKKILLYLMLSCGTSMAAFAQTTINISTSGFTFSPANSTANVGDTAKFTVGGGHTATEVSEATWNASGSTALSGGFNFNSGTHKLKLTQAKTYYYVCAPHAGGGMKGKIVVSAATGISDKISIVSSFEVYPNPVTESSVAKFNLIQPSDVNITVYNLLGAALHRVAAGKLNAGNHTVPFAASELSRGMYLLEITSGNQRIVKKIAVQ